MEQKHPIPFYDIYYDIERTVSSATELTGLVPAAIEDEEQADSYEELYPIHRQKSVDYPN